MHILFCVNNIKFGTKCFVKVEQFVLPFIKCSDTELTLNIKPPDEMCLASSSGGCFIDWYSFGLLCDEYPYFSNAFINCSFMASTPGNPVCL